MLTIIFYGLFLVLKGRSVARCLEPCFVNPCYIIIILQPKVQNWLFSASVLRQELRQGIVNSEFLKMATHEEILEKVPQSIKDKFLIKKRERAIEIVKDKISKSGKNLKDFDDDEMEGMIADEERNLKGDQLKAILVTLLTMEGLTYLAEL